MKQFLNLSKITGSIKNFQSSLFSSKKTTLNMRKLLFKKTKVKKDVIQGKKSFFDKKREYERRKVSEAALEARELITSPIKAIGRATGGFLSRIMKFLGILLLGWLMNNLPTIIAMAKELIARIQRMFELLTGFIGNIFNIMKNFGSLLGAVFQNIITLDFLDSSNRVKKAWSDLENNFDDMGKQLDEGIRLATTSLGEPIAPGGPDTIPQFGTDYTTPASGPSAVSGYGTKEQQALLKTLRYAEGTSKSYGTIFGGNIVPELAEGKLTVQETINMADTGRLPQRLGGRKIAGYGRGSKATGAYQFMPPTLEGLIRQGVLKPNELFTPETQDRAALALAANRGVTADVLKREGFSSNVSAKLAPEWASVPTTSGRSYYGQPVKAFSSLQKVYSQGLTENTTLGTTEPTKIVQVPAGNINPVVGDRLGAGRNHGGVDLAVNSGTPLRAISDGVIVDSDYNPGGWGNFLVMKDDRGIYHLYGHMQSGYKRRGSVKKGEVIGKVGMTGRTSGPHLHWEAGTGWNGGVITGRFDALTRYSKYAPFNTTFDSLRPSTTPSTPMVGAPTQTAPTQEQLTPEISSVPAITESYKEVQYPTTPQQQTIFIDDRQPPQPVPVPSGSSGGSQIPTIGRNTLLNRFVRNHLLLDLAYT